MCCIFIYDRKPAFVESFLRSSSHLFLTSNREFFCDLLAGHTAWNRHWSLQSESFDTHYGSQNRQFNSIRIGPLSLRMIACSELCLKLTAMSYRSMILPFFRKTSNSVLTDSLTFWLWSHFQWVLMNGLCLPKALLPVTLIVHSCARHQYLAGPTTCWWRQYEWCNFYHDTLSCLMSSVCANRVRRCFSCTRTWVSCLTPLARSVAVRWELHTWSRLHFVGILGKRCTRGVCSIRNQLSQQ